MKGNVKIILLITYGWVHVRLDDDKEAYTPYQYLSKRSPTITLLPEAKAMPEAATTHASTESPEMKSTAPNTQSVLSTYTVITASANLRADARTSSYIYRQLFRGQTLTILWTVHEGAWGYAKLPTGETGYVWMGSLQQTGDIVKIPPSLSVSQDGLPEVTQKNSTENYEVITNTSNLRYDARSSAEIVRSMTKGQGMEILWTVHEGAWGYAKLPTGEKGYVWMGALTKK